MSIYNDSSDYYELLGLDEDASLSDVKQAYRKLVADYEAGVATFDEAELERIEAAYYALRGRLDEERQSERLDGTGSGERFRHRPFVEVTWGSLSALIVAAVAFVGADLLVFHLFVLIYMTAEGLSYEAAASLVGVDNDLLLFGNYLLATGLAVAAIYAFVRHKGGSWRMLGFRSFKFSTALFVVFIGIVGYYVGATIILALTEYLLPQVDLEAQQEIPFDPIGGLELALTFAAIVIIAPIVEEIIFRGFLLPAFNKVMRLPFAVILVSILFALLHPPVSAMLVIGVFSLLLCWAYIKSGSLWPPILLHALQNSIAFTLLFIVEVDQFLPEEGIPGVAGWLIGYII